LVKSEFALWLGPIQF